MLDANSNVTRTTYPDGSYFVDRVYDELNRLTDIKLNGAGASAVQFQYDALSRRTKLVYENGCSTNYGFEVDNDLSGMLHNFVGSNVEFKYSIDNANQMAAHRVSDPANFRWNPPAPSTTAYGTASNINQYPTVGGTAQTYSTDGCLTNDGTFKYEFNSERMMTRVRNAGTNAIIADYLYDPALRQRQKNVGGVKTNYYYAGFQRLADYDGSAGTPGTLLNRYVYGTGLDDVLIQITAGGTKTYYHKNHQGSVIATTNSTGAVLNRYTYGPFGESAALTGTTHGYTGQRYDSETGLYYFKMRQYSPKLGRFLQADPIGMAGGMNLYAYVGNSPLTMIDSLGLAADGQAGDEGDPAELAYYSNHGGIWAYPDEPDPVFLGANKVDEGGNGDGRGFQLPTAKGDIWVRADSLKVGLAHIMFYHYFASTLRKQSYFYGFRKPKTVPKTVEILQKLGKILQRVKQASLYLGDIALDTAWILGLVETAISLSAGDYDKESRSTVYTFRYNKVIGKAKGKDSHTYKVVVSDRKVLVTAYPIPDGDRSGGYSGGG